MVHPEQGKEIQVSAGFLENLARALKLSGAERAHLHALARNQPPPLSATDTPPESFEVLQSLLNAIGSPAYARDVCFNVVAWNRANTETFGDFAKFAPIERNVLRLMFTRHYHRRTMPEWRADARALVAKFRINFGRAVDKQPFLALIEELRAVSDDFMQLWIAHDVIDPGEGVTRFLSPRSGEMRFRHHLLIPEAWPDLRIVTFVADDPQ